MTARSGVNRNNVKTILTLFGTRPEIIKLAPVIWAIERSHDILRSINVSSSQHTDLLRPFIHELDISIDHDLAVMSPGQTPNAVLARVLEALEPLLLTERPDLVLVQGDTTTAIAGALAAFYARIPVAHVEAGLRTGNRHSPFPEEMNRRLITQLADLHFAATQKMLRFYFLKVFRKSALCSLETRLLTHSSTSSHALQPLRHSLNFLTVLQVSV